MVWLLLFVTAGPITKLFAWGEGDSEEHVHEIQTSHSTESQPPPSGSQPARQDLSRPLTAETARIAGLALQARER
jgi:hypothetical protein